MSSEGKEESETSASTIWPPEDVICYITDELIVSLSGQRHMSQITALDLHLRDGSLGKIRRIEGLDRLVNLRQLNLSYNVIKKVENMEMLVNLVELNLAENDIKDMRGLLCLSNLQRLNLSGNSIQRIPQDINKLQNLEILRLARNQLHALEDIEYLGPLEKLTELRVDDNPIVSRTSDRTETRAFIVFCCAHLLSLDGLLLSAAERGEANRARELVVSSRQRRAQETTSMKGRQKSGMPRPGVAPTATDDGNETHDIGGDGRGQKDVETLTKLLEYKTNEAAQARAELAEMRAERASSPPSPSHDRKRIRQTAGNAKMSEERNAGDKDRSSAYAYTKSDDDSVSGIDSDNEYPITRQPPDRSRSTPPITHGRSMSRSPDGSIGSSGIKSSASKQDEAAKRRIIDLNERVEKVTSLLLQSEEEKKRLEQELSKTQRLLALAETEINTLRQHTPSNPSSDSKDISQPAVDVSSAGRDLRSLQAELESRDRELYEYKQREVYSKDEIARLKDQLNKQISQSTESFRMATSVSEEISRMKLDHDAALREASRLRTEVQSLRTDNLALREQVASASYAHHDKEGLEKDRNRMHDIINRYKLDLERSRAEVDSLQNSQSEAERDARVARDLLLRLTNEKQALEDRLSSLKSASKAPSTETQNEDGVADLISKCSHLESALAIAVSEKEHLLKKLQQSSMNTTEPQAPSSGILASGTGGGRVQFSSPTQPVVSYLDEPSSDFSDRNNYSVDDIAGISTRIKPVVNTAVSRGQPYNRQFKNGNGQLSPVHLSAAEVVSALLLEEMKNAPKNLNKRSDKKQPIGGDSMSSMEAACTRAALRLVYTAIDVVNSKGVGLDQLSQMSPLAALGDDVVLQAIVERTQRGAINLEEINALKEEKLALEACIDELKDSLATLDKKRHDKDVIVRAVNAECDQAKERARLTINDLQNLADQMLHEKEHLDSLEKQKLGILKDIEGLRRNMADMSSLSQIESKNLAAIRSRLLSARDETEKSELRAQEAKLESENEEKRLRETKLIANDQLKLLQQEVVRLHSDIKNSRRAIEDSEKIRRNLDEEILKRRSDADGQQAVISRELDDAMRKTSALRIQQRNMQLEIDKISLQKRQTSEEVAVLEDRKMAVQDSVVELEQNCKHRAEQADRQIAESEKKLKGLRESISALNAERVMAMHNIDDLKAQCSDLERAAEDRRRSVQEEVTLAQQQAVVSIRAGRSAIAGLDQKRAELEAVVSEHRLAERRLEETRRACRELETSAEAVRDSVKQLETDKMRMKAEVSSFKREEEELRSLVQTLKLSADNESRACEDTRRRLLLLSEEEASMKDTEARVRVAIAALRKTADEAQVELDDLRSCSERERRLLSELRGKKSITESEVSRTEDELKFAKEQLGTMEKQQEEMRACYQKLKDEVMQQQKTLASSQRRAAEALRIEDQMQRAEKEAVKNNEKLLAESEAITGRLGIERAQLETIRSERDRCTNELRYTQDAQAALAQEINSYHISMESMKANYSNLDAARAAILQEIGQLRETARLEVSRIDRINDTYTSVERRLVELREALVKTEKSYELARALSVEEERRVDQQRGLLRNTAEELRKMEGQMADAHKSLYEDRVKAISELNRLNSAKNSLQDHVIQLSDAQLRREGMSGELKIAPPVQRSSLIQSPNHPSDSVTLGNVHILPSDRLRSTSRFSDLGSSNRDVLIANKLDDINRSDDSISNGSENDYGGSEGSPQSTTHTNHNYSRFHSNFRQTVQAEDRRVTGGTGTSQGLAEEVRRLQDKSNAILQSRSK